MGKRYTKFNSNFLMRSDYQRTDLGRIMERDWVTTNGLNVLRFGSGRRIWYNSGNFVLTTSNTPTYHKKHRLTTETREWAWDDVKSADGTVNEVKPSYMSNDLRDYAYYGSCVELIRATVEEIVTDFPGRLVLSNDKLSNYCDCEDSGVDCDKTYLLRNQFNIDLHHKNVTLGDYDNEMRFMSRSWENYRVMEDEDELVDYVVVEDISETFTAGQVISDDIYESLTEDEKGNCSKNPGDSGSSGETGEDDGSDGTYVVQNGFTHVYHEEGSEITSDIYDQLSSGQKENCRGLNWIKSYVIGDIAAYGCLSKNECKEITTITIKTYNDDEYSVHAYYVNGEILYFHEPTDGQTKIYIQPIQDYIDDYFASLTGFKAQLLRRDTKPLYSNKFITPIEHEFKWYYPERQYTWPSNGYCIQVDSMPFTRFVGKLYDIGQNFDEMWTDNLYRSMTHEAIKNFDWSYSKEFHPGDAQDNIDGGERMQKIIRVMGRAFDDVKAYIDTVKHVRNVTYNGIKNCPEALLSDENTLKGFDIVTTIDSDYDLDATISSDFLGNTDYVTKDYWWKQDTTMDITNDYGETTSKLSRWYPSRHSEDIYPDICDNEMMRRLALSAKRIMRSKGTQHGIEMVFALFGLGRGVDYDMTEEAYYTEKPIHYGECVDGTLDDAKNGDDWTEDTLIDWKNVNSHTKGDLATEVNSDKDSELLYYLDPISGTPMRTVMLGRDNTSYLVPYYDSSQMYDGDLVFQGKGGWGQMMKRNDNDPNDDVLDYQETLSYLHVAGNIGDMLSVNPVSIDANTIYYVTNLDDYTDYDENPPMSVGNGVTMSHFFILINPSEANQFYAWKNIVVKTELDGDGNLQPIEDIETFEEFFGSKEENTQDWAFSPEELSEADQLDNEKVLGTYKYAFAKMRYLDSIISTNLANNPHVGYGKYDNGKSFIEHMKLPFKYTLDNGYFGNSDLRTLAGKYTFDDIYYFKGDSVPKDIAAIEGYNGKCSYGEEDGTYTATEDFTVAFSRDDIVPKEIATSEEHNGKCAYDEINCAYVALEEFEHDYSKGDPVPEEIAAIEGYDGKCAYDEESGTYTATEDFTDNMITDKIQIMNSRDSSNYADGKTDYIEYYYGTETDFYENLTGYTLGQVSYEERNSSNGYEESIASEDEDVPEGYSIGELNPFNSTTKKLYYKYVRKEDGYNVEKRWYINTKVLTITNIMKSKNPLFDNYFKKVIMPYIMQAIPSTTILKIKHFSE